MIKDILLGNEFVTSKFFITSRATNTGDDIYHHHTFFEIFYMIDGEITHICNNVNTQLKAGDLFILRPSDSHMFIRDKKNNCFHRDIIIDTTFFKNCCDFLSDKLFNEIIYTNSILKYSLKIDQIKRFETLINSYNSSPVFENNQYKNAFSKTIILDLLFAYIQSQSQQNNYPSWINTILSRFNIPYYIQMGLGTILNDINYNKSYMCKTFKKLFNKSMSQYLLDIRLNYAANLLSISNDSLESIIEKIGLSSMPFFIKKFKEKFNCTPHSYRKTANNVHTHKS